MAQHKWRELSHVKHMEKEAIRIATQNIPNMGSSSEGTVRLLIWECKLRATERDKGGKKDDTAEHSSGMLYCAVGQTLTDVSKDRRAFIFGIMQSKNMTTPASIWRNYELSKRRRPFIQGHDATFQNTSVVINTVLRTHISPAVFWDA